MGVVKLSTAGIVNYEKYSNLRAGIPLPFVSDFDLLDERVLLSAESSVTFSSLSTYAADYQHLQIRMAVRDNRAGNNNNTFLRFNGDTAANYSAHLLQGNGSTVTSIAQPNITFTYGSTHPSASATADSFGGSVVDILDPFETTKYTTTRTFTGFASSTNLIRLFSGSWRNTDALTSISLEPEISSFVTGSRFSLYGIKAGS